MQRHQSIQIATWVMERGLFFAAAIFAAFCSDGKDTDSKSTDNSSDTSVDASDNASDETDEPATLKDKYADYFRIGGTADKESYVTHAALLETHFNSITTENEMKWDTVENSEGRFTFDPADKIVEFAEQHDIAVRGHTLIWHRQTPSWVFTDGHANPASEEQLLGRLKTHITEVVGHFKGRVYAWDVVNEAIMEDGSYRTGDETNPDSQSKWYGILGESYIKEAFQTAAAADPDAKLFYNDYYDWVEAKREGIYNMLAGLLADGVPIHGVGLQCHLNIEPSSDPSSQAYFQTVDQLEQAIELYSSLGLEVQITEMDVSLYIPGVQYTEDTFYTPETFTDEIETKQAERYGEFFDLFRKHKDVITAVTLWGIADDNTWLSEFDSGRQDFPLLFDTEHNPKKAFDAVMDF
jgi:endo-1,4-beta-xylanase